MECWSSLRSADSVSAWLSTFSKGPHDVVGASQRAWNCDTPGKSTRNHVACRFDGRNELRKKCRRKECLSQSRASLPFGSSRSERLRINRCERWMPPVRHQR